MPYIKSKDRIEVVDGRSPNTPGELNFSLAVLVDDYIRSKGLSYTVLNEAVGVLECLKAEVYRRLAAPYEDRKMSENGDVFVSVSQLPKL